MRLGDDMSVRLPVANWYREQVLKEQRWLPHIAAGLNLSIPQPIALGEPNEEYPWHWGVYRWIEGDVLAPGCVQDADELATALASFLTSLQQTDTAGAPWPAAHNFFRGGSLRVYDRETRDAVKALAQDIDSQTTLPIWEQGLQSHWSSDPVWIHGDLAPTNILLRDGRLHAVIDFGNSSIGDPACDLALAWTWFRGESRKRFVSGLNLDPATWARGRAWVLWKCLITLADPDNADPEKEQAARDGLAQVLANEHIPS